MADNYDIQQGSAATPPPELDASPVELGLRAALVIGDDYSAGAALKITDDGTWPGLTGATVDCSVVVHRTAAEIALTTSIELGPPQVIVIRPTAAQTATLPAGIGTGRLVLRVTTAGGLVRTLVERPFDGL